jgi:hypothetical protein
MICRSLGALALLLLSCAQRVPDLDRSQPNKIQKSIFDGEWYYRQTVIDVPYGAGFTFVGETSRMERIRWEVSERYLTAYRTYEFVRDSERPYVLPGTNFQGAPVAQFPIESHFDVQRNYNPATGEQTNVIDENQSDRPWNERKFMRVNWAMNLLSNFDFMAQSIAQSPTPYYVNDPADPDRWFVGVRDEAGWKDVRDDRTIATMQKADYLDVVTKIFATPQQADYYGDGSYMVPACWFFGASDCASADVKVRHSFMRVPEASSYDPLEYPDNYPLRNEAGQLVGDAGGNIVRVPMFDKFGFFRTERDAYDVDRGVTETGRIYLINRWNIWDKATFKDGTPIPFNQRQVRPIVYHLSPGFPESLKANAQALVAEWNVPLQETVAALRGQKSTTDTVFELRDNTYAVGEDGRIANYGQRAGDLRYPMIYWVAQPLTAAPLGYGPSASDPLTGEIISANAFVYGASIDTYVQYAKDIVDILNGTVDENALLTGEIAAEQVSARVQNRGYDARIASMSTLNDKLETGGLRARLSALQTKGKDALLQDPSHMSARLRAIETRPELMGKLLDTELLSALREDMQNRSPATSEELKRFSPATWLSHAGFEREQKRINKLSTSCVYLAEFADDAILGLARELKGKDPEEISAAIRAAVFSSVTSHEVGHTLGLRHNFEGSYDALNFSRKFWELKGDNATPLQTTQSEAQLAGRMAEYQYSSIMDYGSRFNSDIHGIGRYDKAAIRFGYGQLVDVLKNPLLINDHNQRIALLGTGLSADFFRRFINYTEIPRFFGGVSKFDERSIVPYSRVIQDRVDAAGALVEVPYLFCSDEYAGGTPSCDRWDQGMDAHEIAVNAADMYERYYFFNSFKRDRRYFSPRSYMGRIFSRYMRPMQSMYQHWVFRQFNDGPSWEQLGDLQKCYNDNINNVETACADLGSAQFWASVRNVLGLAPGEQLRLVTDADWNKDPNGGAAFAAASFEGLNQMFKILQTPEPGAFINMNDFAPGPSGVTGPFSNEYRVENKVTLVSTNPNAVQPCANGASSVRASDGRILCASLSLDLTDARFPYTNYDVASGYYYFDRIAWIGSFYDKLVAILALTDPSTSFIGVDTASDIRRFAIGYNLLFPNLLHNLFSSIFTEELAAYAPRVKNNTLYQRPPFTAATSTDEDFITLPAACENDLACGTPLDVSNNFTVRIYALLYGMAGFSSVFSPAFTDAAQICVRGNGECNIPPSQVCDDASDVNANANPCLQLENPISHKIYAAWRPDVSAGPAPALGFEGVGSLLLKHAGKQQKAYRDARDDYNTLYAAATAEQKVKLQDRLTFTTSTMTNSFEDVELVRGFYSMFGYIR